MANEQYDVSKKMQRLFNDKQKIRQSIRQAVLKREGNPYLPPSTLFDPAITKFHAMLHYRNEQAKPNRRNLVGFVGFVVIPVIALCFHLIHIDEKKEQLCRSGKVSYKERYRRACL